MSHKKPLRSSQAKIPTQNSNRELLVAAHPAKPSVPAATNKPVASGNRPKVVTAEGQWRIFLRQREQEKRELASEEASPTLPLKKKKSA